MRRRRRVEGEIERIFGQGVRHIREQRGLTQTDLGQQAGYQDHSQIAKIETGHALPSFEKAVHLAQTLGVSLDAFMLAGRGEAWEVVRQQTSAPLGMLPIAVLVTRCLEQSTIAQQAVQTMIQDLHTMRLYG